MPSEVSFLNGLGMWVAGMAVISGFAMAVAASQWWSTSIASVLWVLPIWAVLYSLIERLVLKSFGTSRGWNLLLAVPRVLLSLAIALVVGLPMSQVIYSGSINDQLSKTATARIHQATNEITHLYETKIAAAQKEIATVQKKQGTLQKQVTNSKFLSECEAGEQSCSQTHKLGCGPYCKRDAREAATAAAALRASRPQIAATVAADQRKIALWQAAETSQIAGRVSTIKADRDFLARQAALDQVENANPSVKKYVEFFLAFLVAIDLIAIVLKLTHLLSTGGAYERSAAALRGMDVVEAHRLELGSARPSSPARITLEARAQEDAERAQDPGRGHPEAGARRARSSGATEPPLHVRRPRSRRAAARLTSCGPVRAAIPGSCRSPDPEGSFGSAGGLAAHTWNASRARAALREPLPLRPRRRQLRCPASRRPSGNRPCPASRRRPGSPRGRCSWARPPSGSRSPR